MPGISGGASPSSEGTSQGRISEDTVISLQHLGPQVKKGRPSPAMKAGWLEMSSQDRSNIGEMRLSFQRRFALKNTSR